MKITAAAMLCWLAPASLLAQADSVEARLRALEEQVADLKKENDQLRRDLGLEVMARQSSVKMSGRSEGSRSAGSSRRRRKTETAATAAFPIRMRARICGGPA